MDWDDLKLFLALARTTRLGPAGKLIGQNATTVARRLKRLETALQTTLFEQSVGGHVLTDAGIGLLRHAEEMEQAALRIREETGPAPNALTGSLRVSVSEGFGSRVLAPRLHSFTSEYPGISLDLIASTGFLNPSRREADLAIMLARPKRGPVLARKLTDYRLGLYGSADYVRSAPPIDDVGLLTDHRLVGYVPDLIYAPELRYLDEIDPRLHATVRSSSINAQAELIASGAGCGILPCFIADGDDRQVRILGDRIDIARSLWLVVHRDVRKIARVDRFITWLDRIIVEVQPILQGLRATTICSKRG